MRGLKIKEKKQAVTSLNNEDTTTFKDEFRLLGFRSNVKWKKIVSVAYLVFCAIYLIFEVFEGKESDVIWWNFIVSKIEDVIILAIMISPYVFLSYSPLRNKIPLFKMKNTRSTVIGCIILCIAFSGIINGVELLYKDNKFDGSDNSIIAESYEHSSTQSDGEIAKTLAESEVNSTEVVYDTDSDISSDTVYVPTSDESIDSEEIPVIVEPNITQVKYLNFSQKEITFELNDEAYLINFVAESESDSDSTINSNMFTGVSEDENIATVTISEESGLLFIITPHEAGETYVYLKTNDGTVSSEKIKVVVIEKTETTNTVTEEESYSGPTVYVTPTGKKYHYKSTCGGANSYSISLSDAQKSYGPCKKCAQ